jgi:hypothetical protein
VRIEDGGVRVEGGEVTFGSVLVDGERWVGREDLECVLVRRDPSSRRTFVELARDADKAAGRERRRGESDTEWLAVEVADEAAGYALLESARLTACDHTRGVLWSVFGGGFFSAWMLVVMAVPLVLRELGLLGHDLWLAFPAYGFMLLPLARAFISPSLRIAADGVRLVRATKGDTFVPYAGMLDVRVTMLGLRLVREDAPSVTIVSGGDDRKADREAVAGMIRHAIARARALPPPPAPAWAGVAAAPPVDAGYRTADTTPEAHAWEVLEHPLAAPEDRAAAARTLAAAGAFGEQDACSRLLSLSLSNEAPPLKDAIDGIHRALR